jgi:hypothetical protein
MAKPTSYHITMSNTGGPLDNNIVSISDAADYGAILKQKLIEMIERCASIEPGDTFTVDFL